MNFIVSLLCYVKSFIVISNEIDYDDTADFTQTDIYDQGTSRHEQEFDQIKDRPENKKIQSMITQEFTEKYAT